jgi:hypothetical protein
MPRCSGVAHASALWLTTGGCSSEALRSAVCRGRAEMQRAGPIHGKLHQGENALQRTAGYYMMHAAQHSHMPKLLGCATDAGSGYIQPCRNHMAEQAALWPQQRRTGGSYDSISTPQVHGPQCLRCTYSTVKKVSAKDSCCTAVRDRRAYALQRCHVGEA